MRAIAAALASAAAMVLARLLLAGSAVDLGATSACWSAAALALGVGAGLLARARLPYLGAGVLLAALVPLRGPLCDLALRLSPRGDVAPVAAALLSLVPVGLALGRQLGPLVAGSGPAVLAGACLGEVTVLAGALRWLPGLAAGALVAALLAALAELARLPHDDPLVDEERDARRATLPSALLVGLALGAFALILQRLVGGYADPPVQVEGRTALGLLLPALVVAAPAAALSLRPLAARVLRATGAALLAVALVLALDHLGLYVDNLHIDVGRRLAGQVREISAWLPAYGPWEAWLLVICGLPAAALGLVLGSLRGRDAGALLLGVAAGVAAEPVALELEPALGPALLVLGAAGAAAAAAPLALLPRRGWLLVPVAALPFVARPAEERLGFEEIRRVGEFTIEAFHRTRVADVALYSTPGPGVPSPEAVAAYHRTFVGHEPALFFTDGHAEDEHRYVGLRVGGVSLHADHPPLGAEGSIGRLTRLFARPGPALALGIGGELVAADLADAGLAPRVDVATEAELGTVPWEVLRGWLESGGFRGELGGDPQLFARRATGAWDTIVIAPGRPEWVGSSSLSTSTTLQRLAEGLAPGGRLLLWVDTTGLDSDVLAGRLAAMPRVLQDRCAAFVEPRELDAPLVLVVGWRDEAGRPTADELAARLPAPWTTGLRSRLADLGDLSALLVRDGPGLVALADDAPAHDRQRPLGPRAGADGGWPSLARLVDPDARLGRVVPGVELPARPAHELWAGLAAHATYSYHLELVNQSVLGVVGDIDWQAFDAEVAHYARAAAADGGHPVLHLTLAALLEPLALQGDLGRFAAVWETVQADAMPSWRLALLQAYVLAATLQEEAAAQARIRARAWAGLPPR